MSSAALTGKSNNYKCFTVDINFCFTSRSVFKAVQRSDQVLVMSQCASTHQLTETPTANIATGGTTTVHEITNSYKLKLGANPH